MYTHSTSVLLHMTRMTKLLWTLVVRMSISGRRYRWVFLSVIPVASLLVGFIQMRNSVSTIFFPSTDMEDESFVDKWY